MIDKIPCFSSPTSGRTWKTEQQLLKEMLKADKVHCHEERKLIGGGTDPIGRELPIEGFKFTFYITFDNGVAYFLTREQMEEVWLKYLDFR